MRRRVKYIHTENNIKRQPAPRSYRSVILLAGTFTLFLLVQLLTLSIVGTKGAELAQINDEQKITEENIRQLKVEVSRATSLERIETIATKKLGMKKIEDIKYISNDGIISNANVDR